MSNGSLTLSHPGPLHHYWRTNQPTARDTIGATVVTRLQQFVFHPDLEKPHPSLAPIFLNGRLTRYRTALQDAAYFDALFSAADECLDVSYVNRLRFLKSQDAYLTDYQEPLSLGSARLSTLILLNYHTSIYPELVVTTCGHVQIEWHESDYRRLVVECMDDGTVRFAALYDLEQLAGSCEAKVLVSRLAPYPVWHWFHGSR